MKGSPHDPRFVAVPLAIGLAWLTYALASVRLDAEPSLKALAVTPSLLFFVTSGFFAFPDLRRRAAMGLVALGTVALLLAARGNATHEGWFEYPNIGFWRPVPMRLLLAQTPAFVVVSTLALPSGAALWLRGSVLGALLVGAGAWAAVGFPTNALGSRSGMPRRYAYYYASGRPSADPRRIPASASLIVLGALLLTDGRSPREKPRR